MSFSTPRLLPLAIAAMAACSSALAGGYTSPDGKFSLSGFGTLGAVTTDNDDVRFQYPGQADGAQKGLDLGVDSKVAVQGTYKFTPTISATAQVMSKQHAEGDYTPNFEWAFVKWQAMPGLSFRAGRTSAPLFMISDFRDVGYANVFVRPPLEVYGQVPYSSVDGADASLQHSFGPVTLTGQLWGGRSENKFSAMAADGTKTLADVTVKNQLGLNLIAEIDGGFTVRIGHTGGKMSISSARYNALKTGSQTAAAILAAAGQGALAAQYAAVPALATVDEVDATFDGIGLSLDRDNWLASLEFTKRKTKSYISDSTGWYATVGYRIGTFTPFIGAAKLKVDEQSTNPVSAAAAGTLDTVAPTVLGAQGYTAPQIAAIQAQLRQLRPGVASLLAAQNFGQTTSTLGVRWDAMSSLAVKAQWDRTKPDGAAGLFTGVKTTYTGKAVNVLTLSVDFVF